MQSAKLTAAVNDVKESVDRLLAATVAERMSEKGGLQFCLDTLDDIASGWEMRLEELELEKIEEDEG